MGRLPGRVSWSSVMEVTEVTEVTLRWSLQSGGQAEVRLGRAGAEWPV